MLKLYSLALSPWARKARIALYEKGIPFEKITIASKPDGTLDKPAEFLAANPRGKVPTLIDDGTIVYESTLVLEYLEDAYPEPPLYPRDIRARARCRQLVDAGDQDLGGQMGVLTQELFMKQNEAERDQAAIAGAKEALAKVYDRLEEELGKGPWFCGEQFTAADIAIAVPVSALIFFHAGPGDDHKRLREWFDRVSARESVVKDSQEVLAALS
jgi:glutathione S-transferase